ncbi:M24 family metallopeptidase [Tardisphaera saccharovorans]
MKKQKIEGLLHEAEALGLSGILIRNPENILYATGYWPAIGRSLLFIGSDGESRLLAPVSERDFVPDGCADEVQWEEDEGLKAVFDPYPRFKQFLGELSGKVGVEMTSEVVSTVHAGTEVSYASCRTFDVVRQAGAEPVDFTASLEKLRQQKDEDDLEKIRISYELAAVGLREGHCKLKEGVSEAELASDIEYAINSSVGYSGTQRVRAYAFVMSGERGSVAYYPFNSSSEKRIKRGESVLIELDVQADGYWSDTTRTWFIDPPKELRDRFEAVLEANESGVAAAKIGARAADVDMAARKALEKSGYGDEFVHRLGHGVGFRHHELPALHPASTDVLCKGAVFTVEPGVYGKGFGIRIENGVLATDSGGRRLDTAPIVF